MKRFFIGYTLALVFLCAPRETRAELASTWARDEGQPSTLTASRSIARVDRRSGRIFLACSKPFWAPGPTGSARIILWPPDVFFSVSISGTAITIDGKKAGFGQLAEGQNAVVQYTLRLSNVGLYAGYVHCVATRMDVRTSAPKKNQED